MKEEKQGQFVMLPYTLMAARGYFSRKTGECVKLSQGAKLVYIYLKVRNQFFVEERKGQHFEAQSTIADAVGMDTRRVHTILLEFIQNGVVVGEKEPCSNGKRWHYHKVNDLDLWKGKDKTPMKQAEKFDESFWQDYQEPLVEDLGGDLISYFGGV